jgi:rhamnogalacturonan endolyase
MPERSTVLWAMVSIQGIWYEREFDFSARMLNAGTNTIVLTVPAGPVNNGIVYDYLRLELDETTI